MNKYFEEIDYLRGFAIIGVILIHTSSYFINMKTVNFLMWSNIFIDNFASYAIPLFVFISGFVLSIKYNENFSLAAFYQKRLSAIVYPYLIFSILYIIFTSIKIEPLGFELPTGKDIIIRILTANGYFHLWFFALIIQFYLFYPLIIKAFRFLKFKNLDYIPLIVSFTVQACWNLYGSSLINLLPENSFVFTIMSFIISKFFLQFLFYFVLGIYISGKAVNCIFKISTKLLFFLLPIIIFLTAFNSYKLIEVIKKYGNIEKLIITIIDPRFTVLNNILGNFILVALNGSIILFFYYLSSILTKKEIFLFSIFKEFGRYSFGIYLIHAGILVTIVNLIRIFLKITPDNYVFYPIVLIYTTFFSIVLVKLISYLPFSKFIIGDHGKKS